MPRTEPTTKVDVLGNLDISPAKQTEFYTESVLQNKLYDVNKPKPALEVDPIGLMAFEADTVHKEWLRTQAEVRQKSQETHAANELHLQSLHKDLKYLRARFIHANDAFKNCDEWGRKACQDVENEKKLHAELRKQIENLKLGIEELTEFKEELLQTVNDMEPYETIIEEAVEKSGIWHSRQDCIDKCDALMMGYDEIRKSTKQKVFEIQQMRLNMIKLSERAALELLGYCTKLSELERSYARARLHCQQSERAVIHIKDKIRSKELEMKRVIEMVDQMYEMLCRATGTIPCYEEDEMDERMTFIRNEILILRGVLKECIRKKDPSTSSIKLHWKEF